VERYVVRQPDTVEDREQQQRVLRSLSERFKLVRSVVVPAPQRLWFLAPRVL
jgi:hypothetical protein